VQVRSTENDSAIAGGERNCQFLATTIVIHGEGFVGGDPGGRGGLSTRGVAAGARTTCH
jgi:hypothetical protein